MATLPSASSSDFENAANNRAVTEPLQAESKGGNPWRRVTDAVRREFSKPILTEQGRQDLEHLKETITGEARARKIAARPASHTIKLNRLEWQQLQALSERHVDESKLGLTKFQLPETLGEAGTAQPIKKVVSDPLVRNTYDTVVSGVRKLFRADPRQGKIVGKAVALPNGGAEVTIALSRHADPEEQLFMRMLRGAKGEASVLIDKALEPVLERVDARNATLQAWEAKAPERAYQKAFGAIEARLAGIREWGAKKQRKAEGRTAYYERLVNEAEKDNQLFPTIVEAHRFNETVDKSAKVWDEAQAQNRAYDKFALAYKQAHLENRRWDAEKARLQRIHNAGVAAGERVRDGGQRVAEVTSNILAFTQKTAAQTRQGVARVVQAIKSAAPEGGMPAGEAARTIRFKLPRMGFSGPAQRWTAAGLLAALGLTGGRAVLKDALQAAERGAGGNLNARVERAVTQAPRVFEAEGTRLTMPGPGAPKTKAPVVRLAKASGESHPVRHHHATPVVPEPQTLQAAVPAAQAVPADAPAVLISDSGLSLSPADTGLTSFTPLQQPAMLSENIVPPLADPSATVSRVSDSSFRQAASVPDAAASATVQQEKLPELVNAQLPESLPLLLTPASPAVHHAPAAAEDAAAKPARHQPRNAQRRATETQRPVTQIAKADIRPFEKAGTSKASTDASANASNAPSFPSEASVAHDASPSGATSVYKTIMKAAPVAVATGGTAAAVATIATSGEPAAQASDDGKTVMMNIRDTQGTVANPPKRHHRHILSLLHDVFVPNLHGM